MTIKHNTPLNTSSPKKNKTHKKRKAIKGGNHSKKHANPLSILEQFVKHNMQHLSTVLKKTKMITELHLHPDSKTSLSDILQEVKIMIDAYIGTAEIIIKTSRKTNRKHSRKHTVQGGDRNRSDFYIRQVSLLFNYFCISMVVYLVCDYISPRSEYLNSPVTNMIQNTTLSTRDYLVEHVLSQMRECGEQGMTRENSINSVCANIFRMNSESDFISRLEDYNADVQGRYFRALLLSNGGEWNFFINFIGGQVHDNNQTRILFENLRGYYIWQAGQTINVILAFLMFYRIGRIGYGCIDDIMTFTYSTIRRGLGYPEPQQPVRRPLIVYSHRENIVLADVYVENIEIERVTEMVQQIEPSIMSSEIQLVDDILFMPHAEEIPVAQAYPVMTNIVDEDVADGDNQ